MSEETGKEFREKFEALQAENRSWRELATGLVAKTAGKYVKPEDLNEFSPAEITAKAQELEAARIAERDALLKEVAAERGIDLEQLTASPDDVAANRVASLGKLSGSPVKAPDPASEAGPGRERIRAALRASASKR